MITAKPRKKLREALTETGELSRVWTKFFDKIRDRSMPVSKWTEYQLLGYLCQRFQDLYKVSYSFSLKGAPSKSQEIFLIKKIIYLLNNDNPKYIKEYIDWVFDKKIIPGSMKIRTLGLFVTVSILNEYKISYAEDHKINRSTPLPLEFLDIAKEKNIDVSTYGDLAFLKMALDTSNNSDDMSNYKDYFDVLLSLCFDKSILDNLGE